MRGVLLPCKNNQSDYLLIRLVFVFMDEDIDAARSRPRPVRPGGRSFGMRPVFELPRPSGAAGRVV